MTWAFSPARANMKTPTVLVLVVLIATVMDTAYPLSSSGSKCAKGIQAKSRGGLEVTTG